MVAKKSGAKKKATKKAAKTTTRQAASRVTKPTHGKATSDRVATLRGVKDRNSALQKLTALPIKARVEAVAKDIKEKTRKFSAIEAHDLAEALGVPDADQPGPDWSFTASALIVSVEQFAAQNDPPSEIVYLIQDIVSPSRFEKLLALASPLDKQKKPRFDFLTKRERSLLEDKIAEDSLQNNMSCGMNSIAHFSIETDSGSCLEFEASIEDDGMCIDLLTPYDYTAGRFKDLSDCVTESW